MSNVTWLFVLVSIAIAFPILMVQTNNYFNNVPDDFEGEELPSFGSAPISFILNAMGVNDFIDAMGNIPQPARGALWAIWIIILVYVIVKALPFT